MFDETAVHILGGGIGGTVGAVLTCPLEVVKVRLQSSQGTALQSLVSTYPQPSADGNHHRRSTHVVRRIFASVRPASSNQSTPMTHSSSNSKFWTSHPESPSSSSVLLSSSAPLQPSNSSIPPHRPKGLRRSIILRCLIDIARQEGVGALFKGLIPTLIGVLPSRGVYFCAYHKGQVFFEQHFQSGSSGVYLCAAAVGSITASSLTNPIWFVKTRLQLDSRPGQPPITVSQVIRNTWRVEGIRGFYRGMSASYFGSLETALNFVIYENIKSELLWWDRKRREQLTIATATSLESSIQYVKPQQPQRLSGIPTSDPKKASDLRGSRGGSKLSASRDMALCMIASAISKAVAITATYPHEVARTRLREPSGRYRGFFRTLRQVAQEDGLIGLYRGMGTHYIRQIPNSCVMIGTYEFVVFLLQSWHLTRYPKI